MARSVRDESPTGGRCRVSSNPDAILDRLAELSRQIEAHRAAVFVLDLERQELQAKLRSAGWQPSPLLEKPR